MKQSSEQLLQAECFNYESKYLNFIPSNNYKPASWVIDVFTSDEDILLGQIKWYAQWRQYGFYPEPNTVFEKHCMNDIKNFLIIMNNLQKKGIKPTNPQTILTKLSLGENHD